MLGGTTEFRKMEGISFDATRGTLYLAISEIAKGMEDKPSGSNDIGGPNDIRLPKHSCGAVYALDVDASYVATRAHALLTGIPHTHPPGTCMQATAAMSAAYPTPITSATSAMTSC